jgi:pimeloyl-ACP methyl ester carboxylesterase
MTPSLIATFLLVVACAPGVACAQATVELPSPTGQYRIGQQSFRWIDAARRESLGPAGPREIQVSIWYPALGDGNGLAPYFPDLSRLRSAVGGREADAWNRVRTHTRAGAAVDPAGAPYPVLLLSPGNEMNSGLYSFLIEELASHGYVVVALDHPYESRAMLLSNGRTAASSQAPWPPLAPPAGPTPDLGSPYAKVYRERVEVRALDARFVLDQLAKLNAESAAFARQLDLSKAGIIGHSIGGVAAGRACQMDERFRVCVNLDGVAPEGPFYRTSRGGGIEQPYLFVTKPFAPSDQMLAGWKLTREEWSRRRAEADRATFSTATGGSYRFTVTGATHQTFSDDPLVVGLLTHASELGQHMHLADVVRSCTVAFVDRFLRGRANPLIDALSSPFSELTAERWSVPVN